MLVCHRLDGAAAEVAFTAYSPVNPQDAAVCPTDRRAEFEDGAEIGYQSRESRLALICRPSINSLCRPVCGTD
jgi:hypothetical protein